MRREDEPIEVEIRDVTDLYRKDPPREPIIKSWAALWWFVGPTAAIFMVQLARIKGWL